MAMSQKEEVLFKSIGKSYQSPISSPVNKYIQKQPTPTTSMTRNKSNSIPTKTLVLANPTISPPKSPQSSSPSPTAMNRQTTTAQFDRAPNPKSPIALRDAKKSSAKDIRSQKKETVQPIEEVPDSCLDMGLDRYTFYSSGFSLFDAKSPTAKSSAEMPNSQDQGLSPSNSNKVQDTLQLEIKMKTEPDEDAIDKKVLGSSKSCKLHEVIPDAKPGNSENIKISLTSPKTTKNTSSSPMTISYKFVDTFSSRLNKKPDRNFSPKGKLQQTPKSATAQLPIQTYYLPNKKHGIYDPKDMRIKRSISPDKDASLQKNSKISNYVSKNPFIQQGSPDYGKYDKLFKGIQSRGLGKFTPENYKKLGKSYTADNSSRNLRENRLMTPKASLKGSGSPLAQYLQRRDIQSFCESSYSKTINEDPVKTIDKASPTDKTTNDGNPEDNIESITSTVSGARTDNIMTYTSVEQGSGPGSKDDITTRKRDSGIGKQHKETFEEFFSSAMSYMCEVIVSRELKPSKVEERSHEENLEVLLEHIISESLVLKRGIQELPERVKIGKSLLILLEMMLRSVLYLVRKDSTIKSTSRNRSNDRTSVKKEKTSRKDYELRFEEICGLTVKEGRCEENERNVRDNLCYEIQKRREELDTLESELKEGNQTKMLQYVQNIQVKISKVLREKKK